MLRITPISVEGSTRTFKLEGKLLEPWVHEVLTVCTTEQGWPDQTRLDLSGLTYVDQAGTRLLKEFLRRGVAVTACSGFVAELLHLEKS